MHQRIMPCVIPRPHVGDSHTATDPLRALLTRYRPLFCASPHQHLFNAKDRAD